jgi:hypothetical protein
MAEELVQCEGSELIWQYSSPWLTIGLPVCCPCCGQQVTLVPDKEGVPKPYALPMSPVHERPADNGGGAT